MKKYLSPLFFIVLVFFIDQLSKWWIVERIFQSNEASFLNWFTAFNQSRLDTVSENIFPFFNLTMVWNTGISFGLFSSSERMGVYILSALSLLISIFFLLWIFKTPFKTIRFAGIIVIAGAFGNIWDRLRFGGVIDFLDFYIGSWHYPAFNVADSCIVVGVALILIHGVWIEPKRFK